MYPFDYFTNNYLKKKMVSTGKAFVLDFIISILRIFHSWPDSTLDQWTNMLTEGYSEQQGLSPKATASPVANNKIGKGNRRGKNTTVVSLQMPVELVKVLDEIADAGAFRNRSDVILQAVRAFPEVSRRISRLETKRPVNNK